jgi:uncharacterized protein YkwD
MYFIHEVVEEAMKTKVLLVLLLVSLAATAVQAKAMRPAGVTAYGETLLAEINLYRQESGLNPLRFDPALVQLAQKHSFEMFQQKMLSHRNFKQRFERSGSRSCVENVGWNYPNPLKMFEGWRRSRGHDENMLKDGVRKVGIAEVGKYVTYFACQ